MNDVSRLDPTAILQHALFYLERGWSVIPVGTDKKPLVAWKPYQSVLPTKDQVEAWWKQFPEANVGIVTGGLSGIAVVDVEKGGKIDDLPAAPCLKTGGGGYHLYYRYDPDHPVDNAARVRELTDIRGEGGYVVAPPSLHASGIRYEWVMGPNEMDLGEFPYWLLQKKEKKDGGSAATEEKKTDWTGFLQAKVVQGSRNASAAKLAGKLVHDLSPELVESVGWKAIVEWNRDCCEPPLSEKELREVFDSIRKADKGRSDGDDADAGHGDISQRLLALFSSQKPVLFHDQMDVEHAQIVVSGKKTILSCEGSRFRMYLRRMYWGNTGKAIGPEHLDKTIGIICAQAQYDHPQIPLHNRVAEYESNFWYDLGEGKAVECKQGAWRVTEDVPVLFQPAAHQESQVEPRIVADPVGTLFSIFSFIPIQDDGRRLLFLAWLVTAFVPDIPHPILILHGEKGSSKSTSMKLLSALIDPSKSELLTLPKNDELLQQLAHHYAPFYDNVSKLDQVTSDTLCRAVTGAGTSKRKLYTNDEDVIYRFRRVMAINGINNVVQAPDLLDRSILIELSRLAASERKTEREMLESFARARPILIGAIFSILTKAMQAFPTIVSGRFTRMADFCQWGCAVAEALGMDTEMFMEAYEANIGQQNDEILDDHPVAHTITRLMEDCFTWEGSPTELHQKLLDIAGRERIDAKSMPKTPAILGKRMKEVNANLLEAGIMVAFKREADARRNRSYAISRSPVRPVHPVQTAKAYEQPPDGSDGMDGTSVILEPITAEQFLDGEGTTEQLDDPAELEKAMQHFFPESELH